MARSLFSRIAGFVRDRDCDEPPVHFHGGTGSLPAVCDDARCPYPRLDVD